MDPEYLKQRFQVPSSGLKWSDYYDIPSEQLQRLVQSPPRVLYRQALDLSTAQAPGTPLEINVPGRAVAIYPYTLASKYNLNSNTGTQNFEPSAFVWCRINQNLDTLAFPLKAGRGFRGEFSKLFLSWPAQEDIGCDIVVYSHEQKHWEMHEADNRFQAVVEASQSELLGPFSIDDTAGGTLLLSADVRRKVTTIQNNHATEDLAIGPSGLTFATGILVKADGGICYWRNTGPLYAISDTGVTNTDIAAITEY